MATERMLSPARRWALRELKVHGGQTVIAAGCPAPWAIGVLNDLVGPAGTVMAVERDATLRQTLAAGAAWTNVTVVDALPTGLERVDRVLLDNPDLLAHAEALAAFMERLGPAGRVAAVCRRAGGRPWRHLEAWLPDPRRESLYFGAAYAVWGQLP